VKSNLIFFNPAALVIDESHHPKITIRILDIGSQSERFLAIPRGEHPDRHILHGR